MNVRKQAGSPDAYEFPIYRVLKDKVGNPVEVEIRADVYTLEDLITQRDMLNERIKMVEDFENGRK